MSMYIERTEVSTDKSPVILWDNILQDGTVTVTSEATDGQAANAIDGTTYDYWIPTSVPATFTVELSTTTTASYAAIAAHNLGSTGNTLEVRAFNGSTYDAVASVTPTDDKPIFIAFTQQSATRWRFKVDGGSVPKIGVALLGDSIRFDSGILPSYTPLYMSEDVELLTSQTLNGQFVTNRVNRRGAKTQVSLNILDRSFVEGTAFQDFRNHYNQGKPFFFASNPSELEDDVSYCWRQDGGELKPTFDSDGIFYKTALSLEAYIGD